MHATISISPYYPFGLKHQGYNTNPANPKYQYKYNGKELQTELNLNVYDYGWRQYDPAIGRFNKMDRFSEKYYDLSTYSYTANNPIYFVDIQGDSIRAASQNQWNDLKKDITSVRDGLVSKLDKLNQKAIEKGWDSDKLAKKTGSLNDRVNNLNSTLSNMVTAESSSQWYSVNKIDGNEGVTKYDPSSGDIVVDYVSITNFVHEVTHIKHYENGEIAFNSTTGNSLGQDLYDEAEAYRAQSAYDPSSFPVSFSNINNNSITNITDSSGNKVYGKGGTSNSGLIQIGINSTLGQLKIAYPSYTIPPGVSSTMMLKELTGVKYKK